MKNVKRKLSEPTESMLTSKTIKQTASSSTSKKPVSVPKKKTVAPSNKIVKLSEMQTRVIAAVKAKRNVFFSGVAGTGKSYLLEYLIRYVLPANDTAITASTGIAAVPLGGTTIHSFAGIGLGQETKEALAEKVKKNKQASQKWKNAKYLIIDEISMINAPLFTKIEYVARMVRKDARPFGGIQLIMSGDFLQLPPVEKSDKGEIQFCFESECWTRVVQEIIILDKVYRQDNDTFVNILLSIRNGIMNKEIEDVFKPCINRVFNENSNIEPTILYAVKKEVSAINDEKLASLTGKVFSYSQIYPQENKNDKKDNRGNAEKKYALEFLIKHCSAVKKLDLKLGAQVLLIKNLNPARGLVNGSRGVVIGFEEDNDEEDNDATDGTNLEHKDLTDSEDDSTEDGKDSEDIKDAQSAQGTQEKLKEEGKLYPVVRFSSGITIIITPEKWENKIQGKVLAEIVQIPLILAWSLTIHKCQGMTLDKAIVSMEGIFECAQAYVALSRVRSLEGLKLLSFNPRCIKAHPRAIEFYKRCKEPTV